MSHLFRASNFSIAGLLRILTVIMLVAVMLVGGVSLVLMEKEQVIVSELAEVHFARQKALSEVINVLRSVDARSFQVINYTFASDTDSAGKVVAEIGADLDRLVKETVPAFQKLLGTENAALTEQLKGYVETSKKALGVAAADVSIGSMMLFGAQDAFKKVETTLKEIEKTVSGDVDSAVTLSRSVVESAVVWLTALTICGGFVLGVIGYLFARIIGSYIRSSVDFAKVLGTGRAGRRLATEAPKEISELAHAMNHLADEIEDQVRVLDIMGSGDLTVEVEQSDADDALGRALQTNLHHMRTLVCDAKSSSDHVYNSVSSLASASQSLSNTSTDQARYSQEMSSGLADLVAQVHANAETLTEVQSLSNNVALAAEAGRSRIGGVVSTLKAIAESTSKITTITKSIDDIAFQTNLLALNAAIEAARAGKHGMGFAVVANEVRMLASRSADAAKQARELIESTQGLATKGAEDGGTAEVEIGNILVQVGEVAVRVKVAAEGASGEAEATKNMEASVAHLNEGIHSSAAASEEIASAAKELHDQTTNLANTLSRFSVNS
jgi:methyl-accepting chemotaxis protein